MEIVTDDDNTTMTLHEFSKNVIISNYIGYNYHNLHCGNDNGYIVVDNGYQQ